MTVIVGRVLVVCHLLPRCVEQFYLRPLIVQHGDLVKSTVDRNIIYIAGLAVEAIDILRDQLFVGQPAVHAVRLQVPVLGKPTVIPE